jgi:hypothetical protein
MVWLHNDIFLIIGTGVRTLARLGVEGLPPWGAAKRLVGLRTGARVALPERVPTLA